MFLPQIFAILHNYHHLDHSPLGTHCKMSLRTVAPQQKYGLVKKKTTVPLKAGVTSVFGRGDDDDDDDDGNSEGRPTKSTGTGRTGGNSDVGRVNRILLQKSAAAEREQKKLYDDALGQDPDVFDYDGVYDSMKASQTAAHTLSQKSEAPKARYIHNLQATATVREKEKERIFERKLLKERKQDDEEFGDKEKFVTAAYKQKLMESHKWEYEDKLADEIEMRTDVRSRGMEGFYANLLTKNVAMGGDVESSALSAYTAGSTRQVMQLGPSSSSSSSSAAQTQQTDSATGSRDAVGDDEGGDHVGLKRSRPGASTAADEPIKSSRIEGIVGVSAGVAPPCDPTDTTGDHPSEQPLEQPSKEAQISSARQRFLERKQASKSTGNPSSD